MSTLRPTFACWDYDRVAALASVWWSHVELLEHYWLLTFWGPK